LLHASQAPFPACGQERITGSIRDTHLRFTIIPLLTHNSVVVFPSLFP